MKYTMNYYKNNYKNMIRENYKSGGYIRLKRMNNIRYLRNNMMK